MLFLHVLVLSDMLLVGCSRSLALPGSPDGIRAARTVINWVGLLPVLLRQDLLSICMHAPQPVLWQRLVEAVIAQLPHGPVRVLVQERLLIWRHVAHAVLVRSRCLVME